MTSSAQTTMRLVLARAATAGHDGSMARPPAAAKYFNKVALLLAGRRFVPVWAALHHQGRRSGKAYIVPVAVIPTDTSFLIALPWGPGTDWVRNVRAAGTCTIRWRGVDYACSEPELVDQEVVAPRHPRGDGRSRSGGPASRRASSG